MSFHRVTITYTYITVTMQNVVCVGNIDGLLSNQFIAQHFITNWIPPLLNLHQQGVRYSQIEVRDIRTATPRGVVVLPVVGVGTGGPSQSPPDYAWKFQWRTGVFGRHGHGRYYVGGIPMNLFGNNMGISQLAIDRATTWRTAVKEKFLAGGTQTPSGLFLALDHKDPQLQPFQITDVQLSMVCGIQRRRNFKTAGIGT